MLSLQPFRISSGRYYRILVASHMRRCRWLYALPAAALVAAMLWLADVRFLFLLLIYAFIVVPMALTFTLISCGLHPVSRYSLLSKRALASSTGLQFLFLDDDGEVASSATIAWTDVQSITPTAHELILALGHSRIIAIPYEAFSSPEQLRDFIACASTSKD